jgi:hypothetical protein
MEETRRLSVRPHLALGIRVLAPLYAVVTIENLGPGAALDLNAHLSYDPGGFQRPWAWPTMAAGEVQEFLIPIQPHGLDSLAANGAVVRVTGSCTDIYDERFPFDAELDVKAWWEVASRGDRRFLEPPEERIIRWLEKIEKATAKIAKAIEAVSQRQ